LVLDDLLRNYDLNSPHIVRMLIVSAVAFGFGCGVSIYCILLLVRERRSPYPVWMHTFYLACNVTGTVFWFLLAKGHGWFWFFTASSIAMAIWVFCELWSLYIREGEARCAGRAADSGWASGDAFNGVEFRCDVLAGDFGVVVGLHVDPEHFAEPQGAGEPQCGVSGDCAFAVHDFVDAPRWHIDRFGDPVLRDPQRVEEFLLEDLAGVGGCEVGHSVPF
jgi:hypothetical protein